MELIVLDDGSTDGTYEYLRRLAAGEPWITVLTQPRRWWAAARNRAVQAARGDLVAMTDDDCTVAGDWLARLSAAMRTGTVDAIGGRVLVPGDRLFHRYLSHIRVLDPELLPGGDARYLPTANVCFRRSSLEHAGGFDESFAAVGMEDVELSLRMRRHHMRLGFVPECQIAHRYGPDVRDVLRRSYRAGAGGRLIFEKHRDWEQWVPQADVALVRLLRGDTVVRHFHEVRDIAVRPWYTILEVLQQACFLAGYLQVRTVWQLGQVAACPGRLKPASSQRTLALLEVLSGTDDLPPVWLAGEYRTAVSSGEMGAWARAVMRTLDVDTLFDSAVPEGLELSRPSVPDRELPAATLAEWTGHRRRLQGLRIAEHVSLLARFDRSERARTIGELESSCYERGVDVNLFLRTYGARCSAPLRNG